MDKEKTPMPEEKIFHDINKKQASLISPKIVILFVVVILAGIVSGYGISQVAGGVVAPGGSGSKGTSATGITKGSVYGSNDTTTFKDTAEGSLKTGGVEGEGQFHLVRPGGDSQNVYMTSSLIDLSQFVGHDIKVWGQTQAAQHAGWLMDVGRVEVLK